MSENLVTGNRVRISKEFFCDGHCYVLTSASMGGSDLTTKELSEILLEADAQKVEGLLKKGICLPVCFDGDCALDDNTIFVLGDLNEQEERDWIARLTGKLNIPCGKLILACGCDEEELSRAVSGEPPEEHYEIFQVIEISPAEYLVEIYAYYSSMTVQVSLENYDEDEYDEDEEFEKDEAYLKDEALAKWYKANRPGVEEVGYIIRLKPLETEQPLPKLEDGWCSEFEFRPTEI